MIRTNILEYLEHTAGRFRYRTAVECNDEELTWDELAVMARRIGSGISRRVQPGSPVPVMMEKSPLMLAAMLGAVYAGCFYVPVNPDNPPERLMKIFHTLGPEILVTDRKTAELSGREDIRIFAEDLVKEDADPARLAKIREQSGETDILYDFDVSVKDIYSSLMTGAKLVLIPKEYFATPPRLLDYLCEKKVTSLTWAVSALTLVSSLKGLRYRVPDRVNKVMFSGEAMPPKQLKLWREALPHTHFYNLYGPTEITCNCTYYPVAWDYEEGEKIPIGKAFPGRTVFLLDEEDVEIADPGRQGEICVAGESLARGYYRDEEQTGKRFVMYPVGGGRPRRIYRTGDLGYYDERGRLMFAGRKDFQIKHMGHRIELEEIENAMNAVQDVQSSCCVFQEKKNRIAGFYMGDAEPAEVRRDLKDKLPAYMVPAKLVRLEAMPLNKNGKTDRAGLKKME